MKEKNPRKPSKNLVFGFHIFRQASGQAVVPKYNLCNAYRLFLRVKDLLFLCVFPLFFTINIGTTTAAATINKPPITPKTMPAVIAGSDSLSSALLLLFVSESVTLLQQSLTSQVLVLQTFFSDSSTNVFIPAVQRLSWREQVGLATQQSVA